MKTIEEAAKEYAHCIWESWKEDYPSDYECHKSQSVRDFKAGVAFAQRWIDVKDELPKHLKTVLVKNTSSASHLTGYYDTDTGKWRAWGYGEIKKETVTHWRPIELE